MCVICYYCFLIPVSRVRGLQSEARSPGHVSKSGYNCRLASTLGVDITRTTTPKHPRNNGFARDWVVGSSETYLCKKRTSRLLKRLRTHTSSHRHIPRARGTAGHA
eukprot:832149-Prymnesium_polylepis.1